MTRRQEIIKMLRTEALSLQDLAEMLPAHPKEVLSDIPHIEKSIRPLENLIITPAACRKCGFTFKDRRKVQTPSRCPKCKGRWIKEPVFQIVANV